MEKKREISREKRNTGSKALNNRPSAKRDSCEQKKIVKGGRSPKSGGLGKHLQTRRNQRKPSYGGGEENERRQEGKA